MKSLALVAACLLALLLIVACGQPRRGTPFTEPIPLDNPQIAQGQQVFMAHCHQCHPGGSAGLAPGINDKPLPEFLIRTQIRRGMGAMPAFDEQHLSDADIDAVVEYLKRLRAARVRVAAR